MTNEKKYKRKTPKAKPKPAPKDKKENRGAKPGEWGNAPHEPTETTREVVKNLIACGITQEIVAERLGISVDTLAKYYRVELNTSLAEAVAKMGNRCFEEGMGDSVQDRLFYLRTQGYKFGWSEKHQHEVTGKDGQDLFKTSIDTSKLTTEQLRALKAAMYESDKG